MRDWKLASSIVVCLVASVGWAVDAGLTGTVVRTDGRPAPRAVVSYGAERVLPSGGRAQTSGMSMADAEGRFRIGMPEGYQRLVVTASSQTALAEPLTVTLGEQKEPLQLVLKDGLGAQVKGRVVDEQGKAITGAEVEISPVVEIGQLSPQFMVSARAGPEGRFVSWPLWPHGGYSVKVSAPKYRSFAPPTWRPEPGKVRDLGDIVLQPHTGFLAGRVVDSKGVAVEGVRVWVTGDAEKLVEATSDARGLSRLENVETGFAYVLAEKEGYRLAAQRQASPSEGFDLILYRRDEVPPRGKMTPPPEISASEARRLGLRLLDVGLKQTEGRKDLRWERSQLVGLLAMVDPAQAVKIASEEGAECKDAVAQAMGKQALGRNVDEAIAHFNEIPDTRDRVWTVLKCGRNTAKTDPDKAWALLVYALPVIRGMTDIRLQAAPLAAAGALMLELKINGAAEVLEEAVTKAQNLALDGWGASHRGQVAGQLCERDLDTALALVTPIKDDLWRSRHLGNIAYRIAPAQPERAKQLAESIERADYRGQAVARLCHRLARANLQLADHMAESIREEKSTKAQAYVWMAEQIAETDPSKAFGYLRQAVDLIAEEAKTMSSSDRHSLKAARVAMCAARLGDPEAGSLFLRSLSLRGPLGGPHAYPDDARLAVAMACVDSAMAKDFLEMLMPRILKTPKEAAERASDAARFAILAAMMLDPALCERYLDELQEAHLPIDTRGLAKYALGDAEQREQVVAWAINLSRPDED